MPRKKSRRFEQFDTLPNTFDRDRVGPGGTWLDRFFPGRSGLCLELGCGKGEYSLALGRTYRDWMVLGIDRRADRLWCGARKALDEGLANVAFLRGHVEDLPLLIDPGTVDQIWIPFPDPMPRRRQAKHRILGASFLRLYRKLLASEGEVHVKTDDDAFFDALLGDLNQAGGEIRRLTRDLFAESRPGSLPSVSTTFQERHLAGRKSIKYVVFGFPSDSPPGAESATETEPAGGRGRLGCR